jgi:phosphate/sulfate permease
MGTSVGSGALTLRGALLIAAVLEFSGAFFFGSHVSETLQSGIVNGEIFIKEPMLLTYGMLAALLATGAWLQLASYFGWPVSTTHAIVGGVIGFGAVIGGVDAIYWENVSFIVSSWILSPLFGGIFSFLIFSALRSHIFYTSDPIKQAKKLTPVIVFVVITVLGLIMIFKGLHNLDIRFGMLMAIALSFCVGGLGAGISYLCVRRIKDIPVKPHAHPYSHEIYAGIDKAKKQLQQVQVACREDVRYQVSELVDRVGSLAQSLQQSESSRTISQEYTVIEKVFGYLQILSACLMAFAHGANDVANAIGPFSAAMYVLQTGEIPFSTTVPAWALALGGFGIVIGLATWGWRVIATIGKKITELTPTRGFAAEFGAAATILFASRLGMPISTTHTLVGSVIGVGLARGIEALDLSTIRDVLISWIMTVPVSAGITVLFFYILQALFSSYI